MDIEKVKEKKEILITEMLHAVRKFESETGCSVDNVRFNQQHHFNGKKETASIEINVKI